MEVNQDILKRFDELCNQESSEVVEKIISIENEIASDILVKYGRFVKQFDIYYSYLLSLIVSL